MCVGFFFQFEAKLFPIAIEDAVGWSLPSLVSECENGTLSPEALALSGRACKSPFHLSLQLHCKAKVAFTGEGS